MPEKLKGKLVMGVASTALFDLRGEDALFLEQGLDKYREKQRQDEDVPCKPGSAFDLVKGLLATNNLGKGRLVEVALISMNDADSGLRIRNSIKHYGLDVKYAAFTDGAPKEPYLRPFSCQLFLSAKMEEVLGALGQGFPAALVYGPPRNQPLTDGKVRIAFDGDAVIFSGDSDKVYEMQGLEAFEKYEDLHENDPMNPGPLKPFLDELSKIQGLFPEKECPVRTALVTARSLAASSRPIKTLRSWGVRMDESFFLNGEDKSKFLRELDPHIFFDDREENLRNIVNSFRVPPSQ